MQFDLIIRKVGDSLGVVLPKEVLARLKVTEGDSIRLMDGSEGDLRLSSSDAEVARQMKIIEDIMDRYDHTLRELAK